MASRYQVGNFVVDSKLKQVFKRGRDVQLPPLAFQVLLFLVEHDDERFSADAILEGIRGKKIVGSESVVRTSVRELRKELGDGCVNTVSRRGYRIGYPVTVLSAAPPPAAPPVVPPSAVPPNSQGAQVVHRTQPALDRFEADRKDEKDRSIRLSDLQFIRRATPYFSRPTVENQIKSWLTRASSLAIVKLTGPAGAGKSRLALALCDEFHAEKWLAGFVTNITTWPSDWIPIRPTLVVVDYASSKSIDGLPLFDWLERLRASEWRRDDGAPTVGVVLIDRTDQGPLWSAWRESPHASDFDELTLSIELSSEREGFDAIAQAEFARRTDRPLSADEREALDRVAERLHGQYRPLFALLTAAALTDLDDGNRAGLKGQGRSTRLQTILQAIGLSGETVRPIPSSVRWSPELLVESILKGQLRQWRRSGVNDHHLDLLFEATVSAGTCQVRPSFAESVEDIAASVYDSVASLSEPSDTLGPIMPDLLGEFFVLMRLRGEAQMGQLLGRRVRSRSQVILEDALTCTGTLPFLGLLLQDYLAWAPADSDNPAGRIAEQVLQRAHEEAVPAGVVYGAFAIAWRRPEFREWAEWLRSTGVEHRLRFARAIATGLANASLSAVDVASCTDSASRIAAIHTEHGHDAVVREHMATALCAAAVFQNDPRQRLSFVDQLQNLHEEYGQEMAVRTQLARAVCSCTFEETDRFRLAAFVDRLERLHAEFGEERAVREHLAIAICNACTSENEPSRRDVWIVRLKQLHSTYGEERTVREPLVRTLFHASTGKAVVATRLLAAEALQVLYSRYPAEALTRELLAEALYNVTVVEPNPQACLALANRIQVLYAASGNESAIRVHLAGALSNALTDCRDDAWVDERLKTLWALHDRHGRESPVRDHLARALHNASAFGSAARRTQLALRIVALHDDHGTEAHVREYAASALYNLTTSEEDASQTIKVVDLIAALYERGGERVVAELLAAALRNTLADEHEPARWDVLAQRLSTLYSALEDNGIIRNHYASALVTAIEDTDNPKRRAKLMKRLTVIYEAHQEDDALAHHLNSAKLLCS